MIEPINPGPLVVSNHDAPDDGLGNFIIAADGMDPGYLAEMWEENPKWREYAAWIVRASNEYGKLVEDRVAYHLALDLVRVKLDASNKALVNALKNALPFLEEAQRKVDFEVAPLTKARAILAQEKEE